MHVLIGLATAVENIDEVIKIIKIQKTRVQQKEFIIEKWKVKKVSK